MTGSTSVLCIASYEKGHDLLRELKQQGCHVTLITSRSLQDKAQFPRESIDELYYMPDVDKQWNRPDTLKAVSFLARTRQFDRILALDDFDLEMGAFLREHLRVPGLGESLTRHFRDKLAMRLRAASQGIPVPEFTPLFPHQRVAEFLERVPGPWLLKPRLMAGALGIKRVQHADELWDILERLGDEQSMYVLERFVPGDILHVDSIVDGGEVRFAVASAYGRPPLEVSHDGGIFTTRLLPRGSALDEEVRALNRRVLAAMGLTRGVSHTEFIRAREDGSLHFLETSARVGGAHIADLVEAATGLNLWREWARLELSPEGTYQPEPLRTEYAGLMVCLAREEWPDTSAYADPEVVWRMSRANHVGLIVRSPQMERVAELLEQYCERAQRDFLAVLAAPERPTA